MLLLGPSAAVVQKFLVYMCLSVCLSVGRSRSGQSVGLYHCLPVCQTIDVPVSLCVFVSLFLVHFDNGRSPTLSPTLDRVHSGSSLGAGSSHWLKPAMAKRASVRKTLFRSAVAVWRGHHASRPCLHQVQISCCCFDLASKD